MMKQTFRSTFVSPLLIVTILAILGLLLERVIINQPSVMKRRPKIWPTFFIVGAPKAGTTSLYRYLQNHPQIFLPERKEPHFFTELRPCQQLRHLYWPVREEHRYLNLFRHARSAKAIGEASPSYLITERAAHGIKAKVPKAKIIILVRV